MSVIIRLQNLPISANASNIRRFFGGLTIPEGGVHIVGGNDGDAFIAFATDEDARKAMLLDRQSINGAAVRLFLSSKTEMQSVIESARCSVLFSGSSNTSASLPVSQKTEMIQALDVTAPTLPSSFSSYRNGATPDFPNERTDQPLYPYANPKGLRSTERPLSDPVVEDDYIDTISDRSIDRVPLSEPRPERRYGEMDHLQRSARYDLDRTQPLNSNYCAPPVREPVGMEAPPKPSDPMYRSRYMDSGYDRHPPDSQYLRQREIGRVDPRDPHIDPRFNRPADVIPGYDTAHSSPRTRQDPFPLGDPREFRQHNEDISGFPNDRRPIHAPTFDRELQYPLPGLQNERDFSVRPPWLIEDMPPTGYKRPFQAEPDDFSRKRRSVNDEGPFGTEFVVRVTLPVAEVGVKSIFDVLRGVHIVPKWGIRMEEDALQRLTGYVFIMTTARDSFERSLAYNGRVYKGKSVRITPSTPSEFFRATDSNFRSKCPPEVLHKLPPADQPSNPPHHADGCLEIAQITSDCTQSEIVRFLGVPGLSTNDVTIAGFSASDRTAPPESPTVRALITLPSTKDLEILLSARPRPLRPDGSLPPIRLTPISKLQLESYSSLKVTEAPKIDAPSITEQDSTNKADAVKNIEPLTCAFLTGLERPLRDAEALRLFPSVFIPGDAVRMVGPSNTSAYIDFISENNCRRAMTDINSADSKAKLSHPRIQIEAISRSEMESRLGVVQKHDDVPSERPRPFRERDPREVRNQWDGRAPIRHHQSPLGFRGRSPPRPKFEDPYYERTATQSYEDTRSDSFGLPGRRPRPTMDVPHSNHPPPSDYLLPHPGDHPPLPPARCPNMDIVTVFVENLPPTVTVEQLASVMRDYYFVPGSVRVRRDAQGQSTGQALVDFSSTYDADRMIRELNGYRFAGRPMALRYDPRV